MPSKKKRAKGKARRAAKSRNSRNAAARDDVKDVELQMQRLQMQINDDNNHNNEDDILEEAINLAAAEREEIEAAECYHGLVLDSLPKACVRNAFIDSFLAEMSDSYRTRIDVLLDAYEATKVKWAKVWNDPDMIQEVITKLVSCGTSSILERKYSFARPGAFYTSFFEQWRAATICKTHPTLNWGKLAELLYGDKHTLVSFFRKRIPCKCLDKRYKEVKSIVKTGRCCNQSCTLPNKKVERSKLLCCERCRSVYYCSSECQKAAWPLHKKECLHSNNASTVSSHQEC